MLLEPLQTAALVDRASDETGITVLDTERRRLIGALLSRPHLILSGDASVPKSELAYHLSVLIANQDDNNVCVLQGHPWWAAKTGNVSQYVELQMQFSAYRLAEFMECALRDRKRCADQRNSRGGDYVACVQGMSAAEINFYFGGLSRHILGGVDSADLRIIGTYDADTPPELDKSISHVAAVVHLSSVAARENSRCAMPSGDNLTKAFPFSPLPGTPLLKPAHEFRPSGVRCEAVETNALNLELANEAHSPQCVECAPDRVRSEH